MSEIVKDIDPGSAAALAAIPAPVLPYEPRDPKTYCPNIAVIGCGGIAAHHLQAYKNAGYHVTAICDLDEAKAKARRSCPRRWPGRGRNR